MTTRDWQVKERFADEYHSVALTRDGKTLVAGKNGRVTVLAIAQWTAPYDLALASGPVVFSPDEQSMATLSYNGLELWSLPSLSPSAVPLRTLPLTNSHFPYFLRTIPLPDAAFGHFSGEHELAFSADGQTIGLGDAEGRVMLFDLSSGKQLPAFAEHSGRSVEEQRNGKWQSKPKTRILRGVPFLGSIYDVACPAGHH